MCSNKLKDTVHGVTLLFTMAYLGICHKKTCLLHMQKNRHRPAAILCLLSMAFDFPCLDSICSLVSQSKFQGLSELWMYRLVCGLPG